MGERSEIDSYLAILSYMTAEMSADPRLPELVESYRDFEPPADFKQVVETLLAYVPPKYLVGLKKIILTNSSALSRDQRKQKTWSRNHKVRLSECRGSYFRATKSSSATVWLYVDNIVRHEPAWIARVPLLRYMEPSNVLYHEIGHHIHATSKPAYKECEDVAEEWRRKLLGNFARKRFWYLRPLFLCFGLASRAVKSIKQVLPRIRDRRSSP